MQPRKGDPMWWFRNRPCLIGRLAGSPIDQVAAFDISGAAPYPQVGVLTCVVPTEIQSRDLGRPLAAGEVVVDATLGEAVIGDFVRQGLWTLTGAKVAIDGVAHPVARLGSAITTVSSEGVLA